MFSKILVTTLAVSLLAMTAGCQNSSRKMKMGHSLKDSKNTPKTQNTGVAKLLSDTANKPCLQLKSLVESLAAGDNASKQFTVYIQLRTMDSSTQFADDAGEQLGVLVQPLTDIIEDTTGGNLTASRLLGPLLNVTADSCDQVSFGTPGVMPKDEDTFSVDKSVNPTPTARPTTTSRDARGNVITRSQAPALSTGANPSRLPLVNKLGEQRDYTISNDSLRIEVTKVVPGVKACSGSTPSTVKVRTRYVMNLSGSDTGFTLSSTWAKALVSTVQSPGSLETAVANLNKREEADKKIQPRAQNSSAQSASTPKTSAGSVSVTISDLWRLQQNILNKQFKNVCSSK